tara:strand:+ start:264 stop:2345 length:2082 start_codon:yes stop_codon:yes gene_type:complete
MHKELRPEQIDILVGSPAVNDEFSRKIRELDNRLKKNGMQYGHWDTLNDKQHDIFIDNLFLDGESAASAADYVRTAVESCGCDDVEEDLHHHSPVLMREIEKQQEMLPDITVKIGEGISALDQTIDLLLEQILQEQEDYSMMSKAQLFAKAKELGVPVSTSASKAAMIAVLQDPDSILKSTLEPEKQLEDYLTAFDDVPGAYKYTSKRNVRHIRAAVSGLEKDLIKLFKSKGLTLTRVGGTRFSKSYPNYTLTATKDIPFEVPGEKAGIKYNKKYLVPKGTSVGYINQTGQSKGEGRGKDLKFRAKELTPDGLGLSGRTFTGAMALAEEAAKLIDTKYSDDPTKSEPLKELLSEALEARGNNIDFRDAFRLGFEYEDLSHISNDFGEILAAIWSMNNEPLNFDGVEFPPDSNAPLIDFYGLTKVEGGKGFDRTPVSCKGVGTGGKVSIVNIIDALAKQSEGSSSDTIIGNAKYSMDLFRMVKAKSAREGWIGVHRIMHEKKVPGGKISEDLAKIMGMKVKDLNLASIDKWVEEHYKMPPSGAKTIGFPKGLPVSDDKAAEMTLKQLKPQNKSKYHNRLQELIQGEWYPTLTHGTLKDFTAKKVFVNGYPGADPIRSILSPLLENTARVLNADKKMKASLTSLARQVTLVQTKLNVKAKMMEIRVDYFKDANFEFKPNTYSGGNKVSFKMDFTK